MFTVKLYIIFKINKHKKCTFTTINEERKILSDYSKNKLVRQINLYACVISNQFYVMTKAERKELKALSKPKLANALINLKTEYGKKHGLI